jgi:DNA-binding NtrC family response regulator
MNDSIDPTCRVHVIAVSTFESDHVVLAHIFGHTAWKLDSARSLREASLQLFAPRVTAAPPVILCDETLYDGNWKDLLVLTQELAHPHNFIVTSSQADDRLWAEVLNLGAYDVLQKPFRSQEVFRTIGLAWADRRKSFARSVTTHSSVLTSTGAVA